MSDIIYHWHHIIPKHAGGTNDPSNLIRLTVAEHAEAHRLLWEQYGRWQDKCAWLMLLSIPEGKSLLGFTNHKHSKESKLKMSAARKGIPKSEDTKIKLKAAALKRTCSSKVFASYGFTGKNHSEVSKKKIAQSATGKLQSQETRQKRSLSMKGIKHKIVKCPYCYKSGAVSPMSRFHFENCKHKDNTCLKNE